MFPPLPRLVFRRRIIQNTRPLNASATGQGFGWPWLTAKCWQGEKEIPEHFSNDWWPWTKPNGTNNGITGTLSTLNHAGIQRNFTRFFRVQRGTESKSLTNGKMIPVGRALVKMGCAEHPQLARRVEKMWENHKHRLISAMRLGRISRYRVAKDNQEMSGWHVTSNSGGKEAQPTFLLFLVCFVPGICLPPDLPPWAGSDAHTRTVCAPQSNPSIQGPKTSVTNSSHPKHTQHESGSCSIKYKRSWILKLS